ncbi:unnamed protein product [Pieris brassicae]|uniref:Uncharacterized protein n=1 Tax=Pieris brassicae TaxID=7116 RepID=A0A9P0SX64_PIEBR|nr:unnamed protein product [Pieris brassicae]
MDPKHLFVTREIITKDAIEFGEWLSRESIPRLVRAARRLSERVARADTLRLIMETVKVGSDLASLLAVERERERFIHLQICICQHKEINT